MFIYVVNFITFHVETSLGPRVVLGRVVAVEKEKHEGNHYPPHVKNFCNVLLYVNDPEYSHSKEFVSGLLIA